jgi:phosphatidylglycerophosphatase C
VDGVIPSDHLFMKKETIAVFDFDGTITQKDTLIEFIRFSKGSWKLGLGFLLFSPLLVAMKLKLYPNWKVKQQLFSYFFSGTSIDKFNDWGTSFRLEIDKILRPKAMKALQLHKENGHKIIVVSASIENWIIPWANKSGIDEILATTIEIDQDGIITGKFLSKNCYGPEKVNRLLERIVHRDDYWIVAYGDSVGDKELLEHADEGFYKFE